MLAAAPRDSRGQLRPHPQKRWLQRGSAAWSILQALDRADYGWRWAHDVENDALDDGHTHEAIQRARHRLINQGLVTSTPHRHWWHTPDGRLIEGAHRLELSAEFDDAWDTWVHGYILQAATP